MYQTVCHGNLSRYAFMRLSPHIRPARLLASFLALLTMLAALPGPATAHPHAWIDVRVTVLFNEKGRIYGLEETWVFDPLYTAFALEDPKRGKDAKPDQAFIDAISKQNFKNIAEFDYLTLVESNGQQTKIAGARDLSSRYENDRLQMTFTVLLATTLDPTVSPVDYMVFDPTYYIEMLHAEAPDAIRLAGAGDDCRHTLTPPNPDPNAVGLAASLDKTQSAGNEIGRIFAERVTIRCGVSP
jgi:ABC-type uncharacterized transport system substrate-binding protein